MNLTHQEKMFVLNTSIERIINMSTDMVGQAEDTPRRAAINLNDWEEAKPIVIKLWEEMQEKLRGKLNETRRA